MGKAYLKFLGFVFGLNIFHPRWIIMSLVASFTLTSLAFKCGDALFFISVIPEDFRGISPFEYSKLVAYTHEPLLSYLFNWIMDSLTLGATAYLIAILIEEEQSSVRLGIILWDISIALTLSFFCYSTLARKDNSAARVQALAPYQGLAYGKENILTNVFSRRFSADQTVTKTVLHLMDETRASIKQEEAYRTESLMALQWASTNGTYTLIPVNKQLESDSRFSTRADAAYKLYRNSPDFFKTAPVESWQATLANARSNIIALNTSYSVLKDYHDIVAPLETASATVSWFESFKALLPRDPGARDGVMAQAGNALYANTTLIPTSFYLGIMFILTLSHVIVRITQAVTQHFYTLSIESGRSIFLLTAFLVSALAAIVRLVLHTYS